MSVLSVNGASVEVISEGEGRDLVLLPTLLAELTVYDEVAPVLARHARIHRINFPGFGRSTGPVGPRIENYADLTAATLRALGLPRETDLLGNGFGGFVAGTMAIRNGDRFDKLILMDTGPGFPEPALEPLRILARNVTEKGMASVLDAAVKRMFPEAYIGTHTEIIDRRKAMLSHADPELFANAALALTALDNTDQLSSIRNSTLVVVGLDDQTTPPNLSHDLVAGIAGAQLIELPGIGHCPQLQNPRTFLNAVGPFLGLPSKLH